MPDEYEESDVGWRAGPASRPKIPFLGSTPRPSRRPFRVLAAHGSTELRTQEDSTATAQLLADAAGRRRIVHAASTPSRGAHPSRRTRHETRRSCPRPAPIKVPAFLAAAPGPNRSALGMGSRVRGIVRTSR